MAVRTNGWQQATDQLSTVQQPHSPRVCCPTLWFDGEAVAQPAETKGTNPSVRAKRSRQISYAPRKPAPVPRQSRQPTDRQRDPLSMVGPATRRSCHAFTGGEKCQSYSSFSLYSTFCTYHHTHWFGHL